MERYKPEIEYRFTELYYVNTLFSYMQGVKHPKLSFVKELKRGLLDKFPGFSGNPYYRQLTGEAEQRLIEMQMKSDLKFFLRYRLQLLIRRLKGA